MNFLCTYLCLVEAFFPLSFSVFYIVLLITGIWQAWILNIFNTYHFHSSYKFASYFDFTRTRVNYQPHLSRLSC